MKKIFTLLIVLGAAAGAQAQSSHSYPDGRYDSRDVILGSTDRRVYNDNRYGYSFSARERDQQIDQINRDFDKRIRKVERDRWMRDYEKAGEIRRLNDQRRAAVQLVWDRFRNSNNAYSDNRYPRDKRW